MRERALFQRGRFRNISLLGGCLFKGAYLIKELRVLFRIVVCSIFLFKFSASLKECIQS